MDLLSRLERVLEGMVEGVFSRAFRAPLQPIEIAKRLTREVESHRSVSVSATYVPNVYTVYLAPETHATFQAISGRLLGELEQYLREFAAERRYQTVGEMTVRLAEDPDLKPSEVHIDVANEAGSVPTATPAPSVLRSYPTPAPAHPAPATNLEQTMLIAGPATALEVVAGEGAGKHFPLTDGLTIGRGPANTFALTEPGVSRRHAEIVWEDESWVLRDLGSTNGTFVNDKQVTTYTLVPGDTLKVGKSVLRVR